MCVALAVNIFSANELSEDDLRHHVVQRRSVGMSGSEMCVMQAVPAQTK